VTTGAIGCLGEGRVVHSRCGQPCFGGVALAACDFSHDMAEGLSWLNDAVVAAGASGWCYTNVIKASAGKSTGVVARATGKRRLEVIGRSNHIGLCLDRSLDMASCARPWGSKKYTVFVARLTLRTGVDASERKTGSQVVKVARGLGEDA
jgi:hypothetical protein